MRKRKCFKKAKNTQKHNISIYRHYPFLDNIYRKIYIPFITTVKIYNCIREKKNILFASNQKR